jgi:hypothetical protein
MCADGFKMLSTVVTYDPEKIPSAIRVYVMYSWQIFS